MPTDSPSKDWVAEAIAELPALLTIEETAKFLRMSPRHVYRVADAGQLVVLSRGGDGSRRLIPKTSIGKYLRRIGEGEAL